MAAKRIEELTVHQYLRLFTTPDKFYLKPSRVCSNDNQVLVIDRQSGEAAVKNIDLANVLGSDKDYKLIFGFLGSIKLISGLYLVVVTDIMLVGGLCGHSVFQVVSTEIIPYARSNNHLTSRQIEDNEKFECMVRLILDQPGAYFSNSLDLTRTYQDTHTTTLATPDYFVSNSLLKRADRRFVWNRHLLKDFTADQFGRFTLPLIQGFVSINHMVLNGHKLCWSLVSRRSVDRTGTRLFVRGIDAEGNVANHVVTEQIIECGDSVSSFVLTRGSVPLLWTQYPDLTFIPTPVVAKKSPLNPIYKHFRDQRRRYGGIVCVNLIEQHGKEGILAEGYRSALENAMRLAADDDVMPVVKYRHFDFHAECSSLRYDKLDVLINSIAEELKEFGYFCSRGSEVRRQSGTFRVNCVDCLDRTNVVQSILAKQQLNTALREFDVIRGDELLPDLDHVVNNVWADHADMLSVQYSGTGALKTDYTRTGHRTYSGLIKDAYDAVKRYYMNNFTDGFLQDAFDVFLGNYIVPDGKYNRLPSPLSAKRDWKFYTFPSALLFAVSMFFACLIMPSSYSKVTVVCLMAWPSIAAAILVYMFRNGKEFVDWPRLRATSSSLRLHQH